MLHQLIIQPCTKEPLCKAPRMNHHSSFYYIPNPSNSVQWEEGGKNLIVSIFGVSFFLLGLLSALTKLHSSSWNKPSNVAWYPWCLATRKRAKLKGKAFISQQTCCSKPAHSIHASKYCASNEHGYFGRCTLWSSLKTCAKSQTHILSSKTRGVFW